ncbi:LysR family transcriptional regulator [Vibrio hippocampi]|uniref:PCP degradation transcriptional activation protein n=1 Tax=Vibrio hippocampi TaxID=654686 RepID=A0ABN8DTE9_9VIBR|nr:LysR family transcriptional regulator [Vibrio hippocampi]CAH0530416.1 PCP degradation transcriptional activation protein [Vibrio hippocampi]
MSVDFDHLKILVALDEERNITRAAKRLYVSQSAASHNLAKLRERLNDPLFIRTASGMEPTPFVQQMLPILRQGIATIERSLQVQMNFNPAIDSQTFYIGACDYFEFFAMPQLANKFSHQAPNVRISVDINSEDVKMERVESGRLDLYVGVDNVQYVSSNFNRRPWLSDPFVGVIADHKDIPDRLGLREFVSQPQVHLPIVGSAYDAIDDWLQKQRMHRTIQFVAQSYSVCARISASSGLLFCVPLRIATQLIEMLPLKIVELPEGIPELSLSILSHKLYDHQPGINWLTQEILKLD